ncbi:hypothetical protein MTsN2n4_15750 [Pseudoalteromonas sp. MTN2-4]
MFLAINKKKLKELSISKLTLSEATVVNGGQPTNTGNDTLVPSKTSNFKCAPDELPVKVSPLTTECF